jgi:Sec-independent protein translocase protein TatA
MLAFLNLGPQEFVIIAIVAVVVFGRRLPEVAGQAAGAVQRMRRSLDDLRRETGIDREVQNARRAVEEAMPRVPRTLDVRREAHPQGGEIEPGGEPPAVPPPADPQPS